MSHAKEHAKSAALKFGGDWTDYIELENWLDEPKYWVGDSLHRMFRHHSEGIKEAEERFGIEINLCDGNKAYTKYVCEQHIREDCDNYCPSAKEWLEYIRTGVPAKWMVKTVKITKGNIKDLKHD